MRAQHSRMIHGETKLIGLLGHGTSYTLSPSMHNRAIQLFGLDQVYVNFDLKAESVPAFLDLFWQLGGTGLNVTKPHKTLVASLLPNCKLKSVNTLVRGSTGWEGHSTDGAGFAQGLERMNVDLSSIETLIIMGSGGAAHAIIDHAVELPGRVLQKIVVLRRSSHRDQMIIDTAAKDIELEFLDWTPASLQSAISASAYKNTLLIQASSVASAHEPALQEFVDALDQFSGAFVDLIYDKPSALYFSCLHLGLRAQDGLPMLIEQARLSQKLWWGKAASYEDMATAIKNTGILLSAYHSPSV